MPAAWDRTSATCSSAVRSGAMTVSARAPNPVVTPYTGSPPATKPSTSSAERSMAARAESASRACAPPRATATTSAAVRPAPRTTISVASVPVARPGSIRPQVTAVAGPPPWRGLLSEDAFARRAHVATVAAWMLRTSW